MLTNASHYRHSIALKLALLLLVACVVCVMIAGALIASNEAARLREEARTSIRSDTKELSQLLSDKITHQKTLALAANELVSMEMFNSPTSTSRLPETGLDGARRSDDGLSAAFVNKYQVNHPSLPQLFQRSKELWTVLAPSLRSSLFNFYFISEEQFIRIFPPQWALEIEAEHNFHEDVFYSVATPLHNPKRLPVWTPMYYDDVWQKWMTSLIVPVYRNDQFMGITGNDFILNDVFETLNEFVARHPGSTAVLLDKNGDVITDSTSIAELVNRNVKMNTLLDAEAPGYLPTYLKSEIHNARHQAIEFEATINTEPHFANVVYVPAIEWYVVLLGNESTVNHSINRLQRQLLLVTSIVGLVIAIVVFLMLSRIVLKPLRQLAMATAEIAEGKWDIPLPPEGKNEIGLLSHNFANMVTEVKRLVHGLESEIEEKEKAENDNRKLLQALEQAGNGVLIVGITLDIEYANQRFMEMTGYRLSDISQKSLARVLPIEPTLLETMATGQLQRTNQSEKLWPHLQGKSTWVLQSISPLHNQHGQISHYVVSGEDIDELKNSQAEVERLAFQDTLTHLDNRHLFRRHLTAALERVRRTGNMAALMYLDLDYFKEVNDSMGHDTGDMLLIEVAHRIQRTIRKDDHCARLGGDEFAIILNNIRDVSACVQVATSILSALETPAKIHDRLIPISASIGVTIIPADGNDAVQLMKNADLALYKAKAAGRRCYRLFTVELQHAVEQRRELDTRIRTAIRNQEFLLYWQPQIELKTMRVIGFEALIRWQSQNTIITPDKFLPVAEENGLINDIGRWVLRQAIMDQSALTEAIGETMRISVNLSPRQFADETLLGDIRHCIDNMRFSPNSLELEITENSLIQNINGANDILSALQSLGVRVAIDDFGIGHCSLSYLRQLPVNTLKIDRSFVRNLAEDESSNAIVDAVLAMSKKLKLDVVAEGIEYTAHHDILKDSGCQYGQGYLFGKPMPLVSIAPWYKEYKEKFQS